MQAIDQASRDDIKVKIVAAVNLVDSSDKSTKTSIPNISKLYNFEYGESGLKIWRAFRIGKGKYETLLSTSHFLLLTSSFCLLCSLLTIMF